MLGDLISVERAETGVAKTGSYNAFMTFAYKLSQSFTTLVSGALLQIVRFNSELEVQTPFVKGALGWIIIVGAVAVLVAGMILYLPYDIKQSQVPTENEGE
jgi:Na+/melibiose symporter-like transporter